MAELMLVNPRRRRRRKTAHRRNPTRRNPVRKLRANPRRNPRRRRRSRRNPIAATRRNPIRRNPLFARRRSRRHRRNPIGGGKFSIKGIMNNVMPAAIGAGGALLVDVLWNVAPIPANIKTGPWAPAVKIVAALLTGWVADKAGASKQTAEMITFGSLTAQLYALGKPQLQRVLPPAWLSEYISGDMGWVQAGQFLPTDQSTGVSAYISGMGAAPQFAVGSHEYTGYEDVS